MLAAAAARAGASADGGCDASWRIRRETWKAGPSSVMPMRAEHLMADVGGGERRARRREPRGGGARAHGRQARSPPARSKRKAAARASVAAASSRIQRIGERMRDGLELADRAAELLARARVLGGVARRARPPAAAR